MNSDDEIAAWPWGCYISVPLAEDEPMAAIYWRIQVRAAGYEPVGEPTIQILEQGRVNGELLFPDEPSRIGVVKGPVHDPHH